MFVLGRMSALYRVKRVANSTSASTIRRLVCKSGQDDTCFVVNIVDRASKITLFLTSYFLSVPCVSNRRSSCHLSNICYDSGGRAHGPPESEKRKYIGLSKYIGLGKCVGLGTRTWCKNWHCHGDGKHGSSSPYPSYLSF